MRNIFERSNAEPGVADTNSAAVVCCGVTKEFVAADTKTMVLDGVDVDVFAGQQVDVFIDVTSSE